MQTREMFKKPQNWKVLAGVAAVGAIAISGLAVADTRSSENPAPINLTELQSPPGDLAPPEPGPSSGVAGDLDSPFEDDSPDASATGDTPDEDTEDIAQSTSAPAVDDSPDSVNAGGDDSVSADSADGSSAS